MYAWLLIETWQQKLLWVYPSKTVQLYHHFTYNEWEWGADDEHRVTETLPVSPEPFIECPDGFCRPCGIDEANRHLWWPENPNGSNSVRNPGRWDVIEVYVTTKDIDQGKLSLFAGTPFGSCLFGSHICKKEILLYCVFRQVR